MSALSDKVAIVTDASSGIGYAATKLFAQEGSKVVATVCRQPKLDALVEEITQAGGHPCHYFCGQRQGRETRERLGDLAKARFGGLDVAFNNAGTIGEMGPRPMCRFRSGGTGPGTSKFYVGQQSLEENTA